MSSGETLNSSGKTAKMKQLVAAIQDFLQSRREDSLVVIKMQLQNLSVTIDLSIFDPHTNIASQFFVSLYQLMNNMQDSSCSWKCVDVLANACKNPSARYALIHTYQFIPCLSRLLSDQLSLDKKIHILRLMQDLTCGIKISWQIPHLPTLMTTLTQWIKASSNSDIVSLSLGTLVNLCYKNLPAVYTLLGNVDVREIIKVCNTTMSTTIIALHTCKLFIILDYANGDIPESMLAKVIDLSFQSIIESFRIRDLFFLRQVVEFILDVAKNNSFKSIIDSHNYEQQVNELITVLDNRNGMEIGDSNYQLNNPECVGIVFEFINFLIDLKVPAIIKKYSLLIELSLKWIHTDLVSTQALAILKSISVNLEPGENEILAPLVRGLPIFIAGVEYNKSDDSTSIEEIKKISGLLQLLKAMVQVETIRNNILDEFNVEKIKKVFGEFLADDSNDLKNGNHLNSLEQVNLYTHAIALSRELAQYNEKWAQFFHNLLQNKQIHLVLAQCLYESSECGKITVLQLLSHPSFPHKEIAKAMSLVQPISTAQTNKRGAESVQEVNLPVLSVSQIQGIDGILKKFQDIMATKSDISVLTSDVMELYEYKLASMGNAERNAMASVAAASERCTHLQHRNAQLTAELNRSHQLLYRTQQCREQLSKANDLMNEDVKKTKGELEVYKDRVKHVKNQVKMKEEEVLEVKKKLSEAAEEIASLKQVVSKLESSATRLEHNLTKKDESIRQANATIENLNGVIKNMEKSASELENKLGKVSRELNEKRKIIDTITKMALNSQSS